MWVREKTEKDTTACTSSEMRTSLFAMKPAWCCTRNLSTAYWCLWLLRCNATNQIARMLHIHWRCNNRYIVTYFPLLTFFWISPSGMRWPGLSSSRSCDSGTVSSRFNLACHFSVLQKWQQMPFFREGSMAILALYKVFATPKSEMRGNCSMYC